MKNVGIRLVVIAFFIVSLVVFTFIVNIGFYLIDFVPSDHASLYAFISFLLPLLFAGIITYIGNKQIVHKYASNVRWVPRNRYVVILIALLYCFSIISGIPSVSYHSAQETAKQYKGILNNLSSAELIDLYSKGSIDRNYLTIPIIPFVFLSYHERMNDTELGCGAWVVQLWYIMGVYDLIEMTVWMS